MAEQKPMQNAFARAVLSFLLGGLDKLKSVTPLLRWGVTDLGVSYGGVWCTASPNRFFNKRNYISVAVGVDCKRCKARTLINT